MDTYVIGHKNPDTDSVVSAIAAAELMGYKPAVAGDINKETASVLNKLNVPIPETLSDISKKKVFLVDHNESSQMADGADKAEIIGVLDHHKINFSSSAPIFFHAEPLGSTCSIIAKTYMDEIKNHPLLAKLLLAGILADTIVFKSPTTTEEDKKIAHHLAPIAGIEDIIAYGIEIKSAIPAITGRDIKEVIVTDFKEFDMSGHKIGISAFEGMAELSEVEKRKPEIIAELERLKSEKGYEAVLFTATDIINEKSLVYFAGDRETIQLAFGMQAEKGDTFHFNGIISRKKQVVPPLEEVFKTL
ncbi:MAG: manganese-dependent inorganic pyrophosphatase [Parcubacteria group bacterium]